ncbi:DNA-3-methyladenine glycosylase family protein [Microbacterium indicum]|uniref:DNA-3-methyladenine glycosylase family protein n=1 Tax=Microbacterium indicum TaxID=358100 RepID=UPI00048D953E|nr:3-methyladenine DNA glycosylase [Microbacterium indicum]
MPLETTYRPGRALDVGATVGVVQRGPGDPTMQVARGVIWRASRTPDGVATVALAAQGDRSVRAAAWGPGAAWALAQVPALCGALDHEQGFDAARHPVVRAAAERAHGLRLSRTDGLFDALAQAVLEQKVTAVAAFAAWRRIVTWFGERAPGPTPQPMFAPPTADEWRRIPSWGWHRAGAEPFQSRTIVRTAQRAASVAARPDALERLPGIGPWTAAETRARALGDPDAVSVGDFHLAHEVGYALTGSRVDDDGMLELLEPWRGHRQRVIRLIRAHGPREPRRAPRLAPEDHRAR